MKIKVKKLHPDAVLPKCANETDAGYDLVTIDEGEFVNDGCDIAYIQYRTGISISPPEGYHTEIFPRSSISKKQLILANGIGLVDGGYRNEVLVRFKYVGHHSFSADASKIYHKGDKIAQLVIRKTEKMDFEFADELDVTSRNMGGFGSTGN